MTLEPSSLIIIIMVGSSGFWNCSPAQQSTMNLSSYSNHSIGHNRKVFFGGQKSSKWPIYYRGGNQNVHCNNWGQVEQALSSATEKIIIVCVCVCVILGAIRG